MLMGWANGGVVQTEGRCGRKKDCESEGCLGTRADGRPHFSGSTCSDLVSRHGGALR